LISLNELPSDNNFSLARKSQALQTRANLIQSIRLFFIKNGFLEVETPLRIPSPAPEEHIEAIRSDNWFLQTSPELCMKRLVAAGYPRIFQISKCFRANERGDKHLPEYTMLEWYVVGFDYQQLMDQCEALIFFVARDSGIADIIRQNHGYAPQNKTRGVVPSAARDCSTNKFQDTSLLKFESHNKKINLAPPWERITVADAFSKYAPVTCEEAQAQDKFDEILVDYIEPLLGVNKPSFLYDYPAKLAALAKLKENDPSVSERFELYIGGVEIANGFSELTDATQQRKRFEAALKKRAAKNWTHYEMPEIFLQSLKTLPSCAGIALGIDRLVMIMTGATTIDDVVAFTPENL
jgi:elongation factor P--(R)-beta-lysine ligase